MSTLRKDRDFTEDFKERLNYDRATGKLYWKNGPRKGKESGWTDRYGYRLTRVAGHLLRNHHIVWWMETGEWPEAEIDHKDNDPSNNQFNNLRLSNRHGQGANQKRQSRREGEYKGVYLNPCNSGRYHAKIKVNQKSIHLGSFDTKVEAAKAYDKAAREYFGEYAHTNFKG